MTKPGAAVFFIGLLLLLFSTWYQVNGCNEHLCASIVTKCLLMKDCNCRIQNTTCCQQCYQCLGMYYTQCCSCVGLCMDREDMIITENPSYLDDLQVEVEGLFAALTATPDELQRWDTFHFSNNADNLKFNVPLINVTIGYNTHEINDSNALTNKSENCTVAYMATCTSTVSCKSQCMAMGASRYQWFNDGCCECIGPNCINYDKHESHCSNCKLTVEQEAFLANELKKKDYGYYETNGLQAI